MPTKLTTHAVEQSTIFIIAAFTDEDGSPVMPNEATWTLTNGSGTVVNSRENIALTPVENEDGTITATITITGDDLVLSDNKDEERCLLIKGTYNSSRGTNLSLADEVRFTVDNLKSQA